MHGIDPKAIILASVIENLNNLYVAVFGYFGLVKGTAVLFLVEASSLV